MKYDTALLIFSTKFAQEIVPILLHQNASSKLRYCKTLKKNETCLTGSVNDLVQVEVTFERDIVTVEGIADFIVRWSNQRACGIDFMDSEENLTKGSFLTTYDLSNLIFKSDKLILKDTYY
ncbi:hypothetical protein [Pantoea coffeiphila]|uniref:hypothetical protein n=1 Tax=Pantoea coffeiphila TaxID=1465635 RepID=UPI00195F7F37|nr:hypothetical protein [Pantoea coffeiphila]MBM7345042.1 hypothetical protein [Pantoea coffeiphila]